MFITKKRHEDVKLTLESIIAENDATIEALEAKVDGITEEIERLQRNARIDRNAIEDQQKDINAKRAEIERLRPLAQKHLDKLARDRKRVRGGAKVSVKPAVKKGVGK